MDGFKQFILKNILSMFEGFDKNVAKVTGILSDDIFANNALTSIADQVSTAIEPTALVIITIIFFIELIKLTINMDIIKWEFGLKALLKLIFAKIAIGGADIFLKAIYGTACSLALSISVTGSSMGSSAALLLKPIIERMSWFEAMGLMVTMGISFMAVSVSGVVIVAIAYARMFELMVYIAVSPLPFAFLGLENSQITKKYFLSFAGISLQGVFIVLSIKLYHGICQTALTPSMTNTTEISDIVFNMLLGSLVLVMAVVKSGSWAKSLMDAA